MRRDVVANRVTADVVAGILRRDVLSSPADDDHQLGLVIHLLAHPGQDDPVKVADQGGRILAEEDRLRRDRHAALGGVIAVVQSDTDDLARVGHGSKKPGLRRLVAESAAVEERPRLALLVRRQAQEFPHARGHLGIRPVQIDVAFMNDAASSRTLLGGNCDPAHGASPRTGIGLPVDGQVSGPHPPHTRL